MESENEAKVELDKKVDVEDFEQHFKCGKIKERLFGGNPRLEQLGKFTTHYGKFSLHKIEEV